MIEIGKDYIYTGNLFDVKVKVLAEDKNSSGDTIYVCKSYDAGTLFWSNENTLEIIEVKKFTPLQEDFMNSEKKHINLVACGRGAGTTTAFFYNIIESGSVANYVYYSNTRDADHALRLFCQFCSDNGLGVTNISASSRFVMLDNNVAVTFKPSIIFPQAMGNHYYDTGWEKELTENVDCFRWGCNYFSCLPSDIISGYSTTTDNGYYEVKSCKHPLLKYIIDKTGKIPKSTPNKLEQFLASETNLVTGYNAYDNSFLPKEFANIINSLPYSEERRLSGSWTKL